MRLMTLSDVEGVLSLEQTVQAYPWTRGNFCDALDSGYLCFVEDEPGELCSYAVLMPGVDEAELLTIGVGSAYQRKGLGGAMLAAVLAAAFARQLSRVFLEVRASNLAAIALYRRAGFMQVGIRRAYYRNRQGSEDALVMACCVPSPLVPLPQVGEGNESVEGINDSSLPPKAGERLGERENG